MSAQYGQYAFLITSILTVLGWFVVARQADLRERRTVMREYLKEVQLRCQNVHNFNVEYWIDNDAKTKDAAATNLKFEIQSLARVVRALCAAGASLSYEPLLADIRIGATGGKFEVLGKRITKSEGHAAVHETAFAIEQLLSALDSAYFEQFPIQGQTKIAKFMGALSLLSLSGDKA